MIFTHICSHIFNWWTENCWRMAHFRSRHTKLEDRLPRDWLQQSRQGGRVRLWFWCIFWCFWHHQGIKFSDADFLKMLINLVGDLHQLLVGDTNPLLSTLSSPSNPKQPLWTSRLGYLINSIYPVLGIFWGYLILGDWVLGISSTLARGH